MPSERMGKGITMLNRARTAVVMLLAVLIPTGCVSADTTGAGNELPKGGVMVHWQGENDDFYATDGVFYSFVNRAGQGVKLWTPPTDRPVRGVILHGNPGGGFGGDTRSKTSQRDLQEFAARHDFAIAGVTGFSGRSTYAELAKYIMEAMRQWGAHSRHPELAHLPFIATGGSNAGSFSFQMMCFAPERAVAITPNCGGGYGPPVTDAVRGVPAWIHIGALDELSSSGVENTEALFAEQGTKPLLWAWDAEMKSHENGSTDHVDMAYWDAVIGLRLPESFVPGRPVPLRALDPASGWWVDQRSWDHRITAIHRAADFSRPEDQPGRYGWMPTEGLARLYQSSATRSRPLLLTVTNVQGADSEGTSGVYLSSGRSLTADPGDTIELKVDTKPLLRGVSTVTIRDQDGDIGTLDLSRTDTFSFRADGAKRVHALYAFAEDRRGAPRVSAPVQVLVRDPEVSARIDEQLATVSLAAKATASAGGDAQLAAVRGDVMAAAQLPNDMLGAVALTDAQGQQLRKAGTHAAVWQEIRAKVAPVRIDESHAAAKGGREVVEASAGYDKTGLYLNFQIHDTSFEAPAGGSLNGALDFHVASISRATLAAAQAGPETYAQPVLRSLLRNAMQIQVPVAGDLDEPAEFMANYWDPWDPARFETSSADGYDGTGVRVVRRQVGNGVRAVEIFLPWTLVGNPGFAVAPPAGSRFVAVLGYNGREPRPGGNLRWPFGRDPWAELPADRADSPVYGEIILLAAE